MRSYAIVTGDFVRTGGMDAPNFAVASFLARAGRSVRLVGYRADNEILAHENVSFDRVPKPIDAYALGAPLLAALGRRAAASTARAGGVALVNGGNCPFPGANWVHYVHAAFEPAVAGGWRAAKARAMHRINVLTERAALRAAKVVIANSDRTRRDVIERVGVAPDRVRTIYYGVDGALFRPATPAERVEARRMLAWDTAVPRVAFIGALGDRRKGFDVVYAAWRALCSKPSWDANLVVIGTGSELPAWRARASRDGLAERIAFLGFRNDVPQVLGACDALVAPTRYEAYGAGVHEALCRGLPALVSSAAGVAERYPAALRGLLLEDPESATGLASSLVSWREHRAELREAVLDFSNGLRARSWDDMARELVACCDERA